MTDFGVEFFKSVYPYQGFALEAIELAFKGTTQHNNIEKMDSFPVDFTPTCLLSTNPIFVLYKQNINHFVENPRQSLRISWDVLKDYTAEQVEAGFNEILSYINTKLNSPRLNVEYSMPFQMAPTDNVDRQDDRFFLIISLKNDNDDEDEENDKGNLRYFIYQKIMEHKSAITFPAEIDVKISVSTYALANIVEELNNLNWVSTYQYNLPSILSKISTNITRGICYKLILDVPVKNENSNTTTPNTVQDETPNQG